jgi:hypothetical protein
MATRKSSTEDHAESFHDSVHRLADLVRVEQDLLDRLADTRLSVAECLAIAKQTLCSTCLDAIEQELPRAVTWSQFDLPDDWTAAAAYRSYRDRIEAAVAEVPEREVDQ